MTSPISSTTAGTAQRINLRRAKLSHCDRRRALLIRRRFEQAVSAQALVGRRQAVRQRFLVPSSLVRIQAPQPTFFRFFYWFVALTSLSAGVYLYGHLPAPHLWHMPWKAGCAVIYIRCLSGISALCSWKAMAEAVLRRRKIPSRKNFQFSRLKFQRGREVNDWLASNNRIAIAEP